MRLMPELPEIAIYVECLESRLIDRALGAIRISNPFLLRTVTPPADELVGKTIRSIRRIGKRIALELEDQYFAVFHLMIAGRFQWKQPGAALPRKYALAAFDFENGSLFLTEAGTKRRASLHFVHGENSLQSFAKGGIEIFSSSAEVFIESMKRENHTVKRALTDPRIISGIGNSYSDEILHAAGLSPFKQTKHMSDEELTHLFESAVSILSYWIEELRRRTGEQFPGKVTAFKEGLSVHGRFQEPCPVCATSIQRIRYAENECNYCPTCQTEGKLLADRALSALLKSDWPKSLDELERLHSKMTSN
jgi:formamidopyrimidine-DNA glycosylase